MLSNAFKSNKITKSIQLNITTIERILYWLPAYPSVHQHVHPASRSCIRTQPVQSGPDTARPRPRLAALLFVHEKPTAFGSILRRRFFTKIIILSGIPSLPMSNQPQITDAPPLVRWPKYLSASRGGGEKIYAMPYALLTHHRDTRVSTVTQRKDACTRLTRRRWHYATLRAHTHTCNETVRMQNFQTALVAEVRR